MVINKSGITIRIGVDTLRVMGRATQGVKIIRLRDEDKIASVAKVSKSDLDKENQKEEVNIELDKENFNADNIDTISDDINEGEENDKFNNKEEDYEEN